MTDLFLDRYLYVFVLTLLAIGLYGVLAKTDLMKKLIGLSVFSTAIFLFFIEGAAKDGANVPIIDGGDSNPALYLDPVPHLLILTAIVVGVGILGVGLSLLIRIYRAHGTFDETIIVEHMNTEDPYGTPHYPGGHT